MASDKRRGLLSSLVAASATIGCIWSAAALAANGYSVHLKVANQVKPGHVFPVTTSGVAKRFLELDVALDRLPCKANVVAESRQQAHEPFGPQNSYFGQVGIVRKTYAVHGTFKKKASATAGTQTGRQHICAYLTAFHKNGSYTTRARTSKSDTITP